MRLDVDSVIYFYIFICISLLVFNALYIFRSKGRSRARVRRAEEWGRLLEREFASGGPVSAAHRAALEKRLSKIDELMAYHDALSPSLGQETVQAYLDQLHDVFLALAAHYRRRPAMERAFFAYLMAQYHPDRGRTHDRLAEVLLDFLEDSTVYCRENVLLALCALGSAGGVEHALQRFDEMGWYHHPRLLSDGLATFAGDQEALARSLWARCGRWAEPFQVAVVQFAANRSPDLAMPFLTALRREGTLLETRFALIRYFQRWPTPEAKPALLELAALGDGPAIAACAALGKYPGQDTEQVLLKALHSANWYVRRNAAASLVALGVGGADLDAVRRSGDRYAAEMLAYMAQLQGGEAVAAV